MSNSNRLQFRINNVRSRTLEDIAKRLKTSPNAAAKHLLEKVLDNAGIEPGLMAEDVLIARAGIEALFHRSDRSEELAEAVETLRGARHAELNTDEIGA